MTQDIRLAWRSIIRAPSYAAIVIGSLAIGIAAPVLAFSYLNVVIFRPLDGVQDEDGLVRMALTAQNGDEWPLGSTYSLYTSLRDEVRDLATMAATIQADLLVSHDGDESMDVIGEIVSANYFDTLKLLPAAGGFWGGAEAAGPVREPLVVISHDLWRRQFQTRSDIVGQFLTVNGTPLQIVGVAAERFHGVGDFDSKTSIWLPAGLADLSLRRNGQPASIQAVGPVGISYIGRVKSGVSREQLEAAASAIVARVRDGEQDRTGVPRNSFTGQMVAFYGTAPRAARVTRFWRVGLEPDPLEVASGIAAAMALPLLVLALALVNAGNLVLARATRAVSTWRVQLALGATRRRLVRQPILEGLLLAAPAAVCGLLLTRWGFIALEGTVPIDPILDWRVVVFAFMVAAATPLVFGLLPAWSVLSRARHAAPGHSIRPARSRTRTALVVVQTALSLALLGTGTQFVRTVRAGLNDGLGDGDRMIVAAVNAQRLNVPQAETDAFYERMLQRVRLVPGASRAAFLAGLNPVGRRGPEANTSWWLPEDPADMPRGATIAYMTEGFLPTIGVTLTSGRTLTTDDHRAPGRTVLVNEPFAQQLGGRQPVGMTVRLGPTAPTGARVPHAQGVDVTIVGVVRVAGGRVAGGGRDDARAPTIYAPVPLVHLPARTLYVPFDDEGTLTAALVPLQAAIRDGNGRTAGSIARLDDVRWRRSEPRRFMAVAVTAAGALALLLAAVGLYGAIAYLVEIRTREIGIRMALGATPSSILKTVIREAMTIAVAGCGIGLAGGAAVAIIVRSQMYGTSTIDPLSFGGMIGVLLIIMLAASAVPAARASRIDPAITLRSE